MGWPGGCPGAALARRLLLLSLPALCSAGLGEPGPTIDGQARALCALREGESRSFTCRAPRPVPGAALLWYLDGQRQEANCSATDAVSTITLTARRSDRQLSCSVMDVASGETRNASVLLDVQSGPGRRLTSPMQMWLSRAFDKPEILQADARYQEAEGTGLLLLLFVLVQANPPASITWLAPDGHVMANTSEFLLLGTTHHPGLANHSLRVHLGSVAANFSISVANSVGVTTTSVTTAGVTTASLLPTGLLDTRVELPLLGVALGAALALSALVTLGSCAAGLACHRTKPVPGAGPEGGGSPPRRGSGSQHPQRTSLPRQSRSLPPDVRLSDLALEPKASPGEEQNAQPVLQNSLVLSKLGFVQLPASGRIYKVPSVSSEEIWL